jgi:hypothetical protein
MDLEHTFNSLKLTPDLTFFHPRKGFEDKRGSESFDFYVVTRGRVPGIYTHQLVRVFFVISDLL